MIYLIKKQNSDFVKIGYSSCVKTRLQQLQTSSPEILILVSTKKGNLNDEKKIHKQLKNFCVLNEWYNYQDIKSFVNKYFKIESLADETKLNYRTTEGLKWISMFKGQELQMLMLLTHFENINTHIVSLSPLIREEIRSILKIKPSAFSNIIKELSNKKCLIKLSHSDLLLNPIYFYKGSSSNLKNRIEEFNNKITIKSNSKNKIESK